MLDLDQGSKSAFSSTMEKGGLSKPQKMWRINRSLIIHEPYLWIRSATTLSLLQEKGDPRRFWNSVHGSQDQD
jgi:hypothetical protein